MGTDFEREREEYIRRSSQERNFFDYYIGRPHPAMSGGGSRRPRRRGTRATGSRVLAVSVLIGIFVLPVLAAALSFLTR
jgi:hypothetical protein